MKKRYIITSPASREYFTGIMDEYWSYSVLDAMLFEEEGEIMELLPNLSSVALGMIKIVKIETIYIL